MTTEQLIAELTHRRVHCPFPDLLTYLVADVMTGAREKTVRIKREHAEAFGQDDDKDEIEWTGTRLLRTRVFGGVIE